MSILSLALAATVTLSGGQNDVVARASQTTSVAAASTAQVGRTAAKKPGGEQVYCTVDSPTGTRIPRKTCHTRKEWQQLGWDPLDPK